MGKKLNLIGEQFGRLTVVKEGEGRRTKGGAHQRTWVCECSCGNSTEVSTGRLRKGHTASCGCLHKDTVIARSTTHGRASKGNESKEYTAWLSMKQRCLNPNNIEYENYGGRGIKICPEWIDNFEAFYKHVGDAPSVKHSIDRIDNDGNYKPGNVRWATTQIQNLNQGIRRDNTSGCKGVGKDRTRWYAKIQVNGKRITLGYFGTKEEAIAARLEAEEKYYKPLVSK